MFRASTALSELTGCGPLAFDVEKIHRKRDSNKKTVGSARRKFLKGDLFERIFRFKGLLFLTSFMPPVIPAGRPSKEFYMA